MLRNPPAILMNSLEMTPSPPLSNPSGFAGGQVSVAEMR